MICLYLEVGLLMRVCFNDWLFFCHVTVCCLELAVEHLEHFRDLSIPGSWSFDESMFQDCNFCYFL